MTELRPLDPRSHAFRADLADLRLRGLVEAARFVEGVPCRVAAASAPLRREARQDAPIDTEALRGERMRVFERTAEGWAWAQLDTDGYVGFVPSDALGPAEPAPTHRISALRTFVYPAAEMRLPPREALSLGASLACSGEAETRGTRFLLLADGSGAVVSRHLVPVDGPVEPDFVAVAARFLNVPYLWGGRTSLGIDCSGLLQVALAAAGIAAPRDSDQQAVALGEIVEGGLAAPLRRGDLVFWKGHVGMLADPGTLLHASGHHMAVVAEPLADAVARIAASGSSPTAVRRLAGAQ